MPGNADALRFIGVYLAKNVFQLHGAAADGSVVFRKKLLLLQFGRLMAGQRLASWHGRRVSARTIGRGKWSGMDFKFG